MSQWLVVVLLVYMVNHFRPDAFIRDAAIRMDEADDEAKVKEQEYQQEQNVWWRKLLRKVRPPNGEEYVNLEIDRTDRRKWRYLIVGMDELKQIMDAGDRIIFSGGACNYIDQNGFLQRNTARDAINDRLNRLKKFFFDPQIDQGSHGREYDYDKDGPTEKTAVKESKLDIYEINDKSLGAVTMLEVLRDIQNAESRRIVLFSAADLSFKPLGLDNPDPEKRARIEVAHKKEFVKAMNSMRREVVSMLTQDGYVYGENNQQGNVQILYESDRGKLKGEEEEIIEITDNQPHLPDLLRAYYLAMQKKKIAIFFSGSQQDDRGRLTVDEARVQFDLDDYVGQGNEMRGLLEGYMKNDETSSVVYSSEDAIKILEDELQVN